MATFGGFAKVPILKPSYPRLFPANNGSYTVPVLEFAIAVLNGMVKITRVPWG